MNRNEMRKAVEIAEKNKVIVTFTDIVEKYLNAGNHSRAISVREMVLEEIDQAMELMSQN